MTSYTKQLGEHFKKWMNEKRERQKLTHFDLKHLFDFAEYHKSQMDMDLLTSVSDSEFERIAKETTAEFFMLKWDVIEGMVRIEDYVDARSAFSFIMKSRGLTLKQIGKILNGRDHSSVINLLQRIDSRKGLWGRISLLSKVIESKIIVDEYRRDRETGEGVEGKTQPSGQDKKQSTSTMRSLRRER